MRKSYAARLAVAVVCAAVIAMSASCSSASPRHARLALPTPAGPYQVGTVSLHLIDRSRRNPFAASPPYRELMAGIWYPAQHAARYPLARYMLPGAAARFGSPGGHGQQLLGVPPGKVDWAAIRTGGRVGAPVARQGGPFPVVLFSPDLEDPRALDTTLVQDLASRGYVVVTIDHTYDASEVEFPGGRVVGSQLPKLFRQAQRKHQTPMQMQRTILAWAKKDVAVRVGDTRFVLDELTALGAGHNPDAEHRPLPPGLAGVMNLGRIGMFGESFGGMIAAQAMYEDPRISAGTDLDGNDVGAGPRNNSPG